MTPPPRLAEEAAHWALRLEANASQAEPLTSQDWIDFTAWLAADPAHPRALDEAEAILDLREAKPAESKRRRTTRMRSRVAVGAGLAIAAATAAAVILTQAPAVAPRVYAAGAVPSRFALEDGSTVWLDRNTRLTVRLERDRRLATMSPSGHALLDVRHTPARPFTVTVGSSTVKVLGTRFDVDGSSEGLRVAVARGEVEVDLGSDPRRAWRVPAGWRFAQASTSGELAPASASAVGAWTRGQLVYDGAPWSEVARDLSRYWGRPVHVDPSLSRARFSGVVQLGAESEMSKEIELFAPVSVQSDATATVLKARAARP